MNTETYIIQKLKKLSDVDKILAAKIVETLGYWATVQEVASYLKKHTNTIYEKINNGEILARVMGGRKLIYTPSLILILV